MQQPNCVECVISSNGDKIKVHVEREFIVEVIGETKVFVAVYPEQCDSEDDQWGLDVEDEDFEDLDPDFLHEKKDRERKLGRLLPSFYS